MVSVRLIDGNKDRLMPSACPTRPDTHASIDHLGYPELTADRKVYQEDAALSTISDPTKDLRRHIGVFLILVGGAPLLMFGLLARSPGGPDFPVTPVLFAAPFIVIGAVVTAIGMFTDDPKRSAQRVGAGAALIILGDALIFGIRAALV